MDPSHPFEKIIIDKMINKIYTKKYDSIVAVNPEYRKVWKFKNNNLADINDENFMPREIKNERLLVSLGGLCFIP